MAGFSKVVATIFLMMLLVFATDMMAEAKICEALSGNFKGLCLSSRDCGNVCRREGFTDGSCIGFRLQCFCTKPCA